jgi:outer membrane protein TolC
MRRFLPVVLLAIAAVRGAAAEELTMTEAIESALANNLAVQSAAERAQGAAERSRQAKGYRLPQLDLSEIYSYTNNPAEVFAFQLNQERFSFADFMTTDPNTPDPLSTFITRLELMLPIYTGGQLGTRVDQADHMATAEELRWQHAQQQVAFDTVTAFTNLAKAREQVGLLTTARATTARHVELASSYAGQGLILQAEVLKAQVFLAEMDELFVQAANGARLAEAALNFTMGTDQNIPRELAPLEPPPATPGELDDWRMAAVERRRDLEAARRELEAGRLEEKTAKPWYLPEVAASARYDLYDDTVFGSHGGSGSVMAFARLDLYSGGRESAGREAARHDAAAWGYDIRRFEEGVKLEVQQAWHDLRTAEARLATAANSLQAAREALRVREHRFTQGLDKMIDLLDAETTAREAELRELVARYDVSLSSYRLLFTSGANLTPPTEESP